jgi:hypothetical protein
MVNKSLILSGQANDNIHYDVIGNPFENVQEAPVGEVGYDHSYFFIRFSDKFLKGTLKLGSLYNTITFTYYHAGLQITITCVILAVSTI